MSTGLGVDHHNIRHQITIAKEVRDEYWRSIKYVGGAIAGAGLAIYTYVLIPVGGYFTWALEAVLDIWGKINGLVDSAVGLATGFATDRIDGTVGNMLRETEINADNYEAAKDKRDELKALAESSINTMMAEAWWSLWREWDQKIREYEQSIEVE